MMMTIMLKYSLRASSLGGGGKGERAFFPPPVPHSRSGRCIFSVSDRGILEEKKIRVLLSGVEPKTFRLLIRYSNTELQETRGS